MAGVPVLKPELCIIGGGVAGYGLALGAAALGLDCVMVDRRADLGRGQAADLAFDMLVCGAHEAAEPALGHDAFAQLRRRIGLAIGGTAANASAARLRALGVTVLHAQARFTDSHTVAAGETRIKAHRFVIATGARPTIPRIAGIELIRPMTFESILAVQRVPPRLAVLGGSPEAFELAQAFQRLGSRVTLLAAMPEPTIQEPEVSAALTAGLLRDGVALHHAPVTRLNPTQDGMDLLLENGTRIEASHLLVASGRTPFMENLGLDRAQVTCTAGAPAVSGNLRTSNRRVFAMGDVLGSAVCGPAAIALQTGVVLRAAFFRQPTAWSPDEVPTVLRTRPPVARIGATEAAARMAGRNIEVYRWTFGENDRAVATGQTEGHVKIVAAPGGRVLGVSIVGAQAGELIVPWCLALARKIPLDAMANLPVPQPSLSDVPRRAALGFVTGQLRSPWLKRLRGLIARLG